jgi:hypothetical protein
MPLPILPLEIINKILIFRPRHPLAQLLKPKIRPRHPVADLLIPKIRDYNQYIELLNDLSTYPVGYNYTFSEYWDKFIYSSEKMNRQQFVVFRPRPENAINNYEKYKNLTIIYNE